MNLENVSKRIAQVVILGIALFVAGLFFTNPLVRLFTQCVGSVEVLRGDVQEVCGIYRTWFIIEFVLSSSVFYLNLLLLFVALLLLAVESRTEQVIFGHCGTFFLAAFLVIVAFRMALLPTMQQSDFIKQRTSGILKEVRLELKNPFKKGKEG